MFKLKRISIIGVTLLTFSALNVALTPHNYGCKLPGSAGASGEAARASYAHPASLQNTDATPATERRHRFIRRIKQENDPVEITAVKINGETVDSAAPFLADDDWLKDLTIEVRNVSNREIIYIEIALDIPKNDNFTSSFYAPLVFGRHPQPGNGALPADFRPLAPGGVVTLSPARFDIETARRKLPAEATGKALRFNRVQLYTATVFFDRDTMWGLGEMRVRDPRTGAWRAVSAQPASRPSPLVDAPPTTLFF